MGKRILQNRYRLQSLVGRGGSAQVWLGEDLQLGRKAAVKQLSAKEERGLAEARLLAGLNHGAIPRLWEWIREDEEIFLVMDYIEGRSLETVRQREKITARQAADWGIQLCRVLEYLHRQNPPILYRDMKPANVILDPEGFLHLVDFGAAAPARGREKSYGTPGYAAPEQYQGEAGPDSDVYGLGRLLQELLPGKSRGSLRRILKKSVHRDRGKRFSTAAEFREALEAWEKRRGGRWKVRAAQISAAIFLLTFGWFIAREARELQYREALRLGRGAVMGQRGEEEIHRFYGRAIYWEPGRAEPYLELLAYYEERGESALGRYYVEEYRRAYPGALEGPEKARVEESLQETGGITPGETKNSYASSEK